MDDDAPSPREGHQAPAISRLLRQRHVTAVIHSALEFGHSQSAKLDHVSVSCQSGISLYKDISRSSDPLSAPIYAVNSLALPLPPPQVTYIQSYT